MRDTTLVSDRFMINEELLISLAVNDKQDGFFCRSLTFYENIHDKPMFLVTEKQLKWLMDLESRLHREHDKQMSTLEAPRASRVKSKYNSPVASTGEKPSSPEMPKSVGRRIRELIRIFLYGAP